MIVVSFFLLLGLLTFAASQTANLFDYFFVWNKGWVFLVSFIIYTFVFVILFFKGRKK